MAARILLLAFAVLLVAGCDGGPDEGEVNQVVATFVDSRFPGDGERACSVLTGRFKREIIKEETPFRENIKEKAPDSLFGEIIKDETVFSCQSAFELRALSRSLSTTPLSSILFPIETRETKTEIDGDRATVSYTRFGGGYNLVKVDGKWYIDDSFYP